jgi:hypothetical protein
MDVRKCTDEYVARRCLWNRCLCAEDRQRRYLYGEGRNSVVMSFFFWCLGLVGRKALEVTKVRFRGKGRGVIWLVVEIRSK